MGATFFLFFFSSSLSDGSSSGHRLLLLRPSNFLPVYHLILFVGNPQMILTNPHITIHLEENVTLSTFETDGLETETDRLIY